MNTRMIPTIVAIFVPIFMFFKRESFLLVAIFAESGTRCGHHRKRFHVTNLVFLLNKFGVRNILTSVSAK